MTVLTTATHAALFNYDIILQILDRQPTGSPDRAVLATCARVCQAWQEPASRVLWRRLSHIQPLWMLLAGHKFSPEAKWISAFWQFVDPHDFVNNLVNKDRGRWNRFRVLASYVREIDMVTCAAKELKLIHALSAHLTGATILPSVQKLTWRHADPTDTSVLLLCPPSLQSLDVSTSRLNTETSVIRPLLQPQHPSQPPEADLTLARLADVAPSLRQLTISGVAPRSGAMITPYVSRLTNLRSLHLRNRACLLNPEQIRAILLGAPQLDTLVTRITDFGERGPPVLAPALRELMLLESRSPDILSALSGFFDCPDLTCLDVFAEEEIFSPTIAQIIPVIAAAPFASSLRTLGVFLLNDLQPRLDSDPERSPHLATVLHPILGLRALENIRLTLGTSALLVEDADMRKIAQAWPAARNILLQWLGFGPRAQPPLTILRHFATHCPRLRKLAFTKLTATTKEEGPAVTAPKETVVSGAGHPLESLHVRFMLGTGDNRVSAARLIAELFPNLILGEPPQAPKPRPGRTERSFRVTTGMSWEMVEHEIRVLRGEVAAGNEDEDWSLR